MDLAMWRILLIEDDAVLAKQTSAALSRRPVGANDQMASVDVADGFDSGLQKLATTRYDLVVLDIRDESRNAHEPAESAGDEATEADVGIRLYDEIRNKRSVPVIFYSAVAHLVQDQHNPPFVTVVSKLDPDEHALRKAVTGAVDSRLPALYRALNQYTEEVLRIYLQDFVERHWDDLSQPRREPDLAHLLARRLALSLSDGSGLEQELSSVPGPEPRTSTDRVHPMRMYVVPPIGNWTTGDILLGPLGTVSTEPIEITPSGEAQGVPSPSVGERDDYREPGTEERKNQVAPGDTSDDAKVGCPKPAAYWVMLTPACDLVDGRVKADYVVLAACRPLSDEDETRAWLGDTTSTSKRSKLDALLTNNRKDRQADRFHALPPAWDIPGLLVDFQCISHVSYAELSRFKRIATLDDPYSQSLISRFGRYLGRFGTPDVDLEVVRGRLSE